MPTLVFTAESRPSLSSTLTRCDKQYTFYDPQTHDQPAIQSDDSATHRELGCSPILPTMVPKSQISVLPNPGWLFVALPACMIFWWASPTPRPSLPLPNPSLSLCCNPACKTMWLCLHECVQHLPTINPGPGKSQPFKSRANSLAFKEQNETANEPARHFRGRHNLLSTKLTH